MHGRQFVSTALLADLACIMTIVCVCFQSLTDNTFYSISRISHSIIGGRWSEEGHESSQGHGQINIAALKEARRRVGFPSRHGKVKKEWEEESHIRPIYIGKNQNPKNLGFLL